MTSGVMSSGASQVLRIELQAVLVVLEGFRKHLRASGRSMALCAASRLLGRQHDFNLETRTSLHDLRAAGIRFANWSVLVSPAYDQDLLGRIDPAPVGTIFFTPEWGSW
jgi:hypothetical protein